MSDTSTFSDTNSLMSSNNFKRYKCSTCDRTLSTRYNLERHMKTFHNDDSNEILAADMEGNESETDETMSTEKSSTEDNESETDENMSEGKSSTEDDESEADKNMSEGESSTEETEISEDEGSDVEDNHVTRMFRKIFIKVYCEHEDELAPWISENAEKYMSQNEAIKNAVLNNDKAKKSLRHLLTENIIDINEQRRHPIFKAIMKKANELMEDGFDENEAIASAVAYRKHGIHNLIKFI